MDVRNTIDLLVDANEAIWIDRKKGIFLYQGKKWILNCRANTRKQSKEEQADLINQFFRTVTAIDNQIDMVQKSIERLNKKTGNP